MNLITMPKSCISCQNYEHKGMANDEHCPHTNRLGEQKSRTKYGKCTAHKTEVFITEICNQYHQEELINVQVVTNRPTAKQTRQERLI